MNDRTIATIGLWITGIAIWAGLALAIANALVSHALQASL